MAKKKHPEPVRAKPAPMKKVEHKGYTAVQSPRNNHVMIGKDGKMVYHATCVGPLSDNELCKIVDEFLTREEKAR